MSPNKRKEEQNPMQQQQQTTLTRPQPGPLTTHRPFRRPAGAHTIIVHLLLADGAVTLFWLCIGGFLAPLCWSLLDFVPRWLHTSLLLDITLVLSLFFLLLGLIVHVVGKQRVADAWTGSLIGILLLLTSFVLLFLLRPSWMTIPAPLPSLRLHPSPWLQSPSPGILLVVIVSLLAHVTLWRRMQLKSEEQLRAYARAHQGGIFSSLIEQYYRDYRKQLTRFEPPPVSHLKTPPTFLYTSTTSTPSQAQGPFPLERLVYWVNEQLIIDQTYLTPAQEHIEVLHPLLARSLYQYNSPQALVEILLRFSQLASTSRWRYWFWLPLWIARSCECQWQALERDRILDQDRFAYWCGSGRRLRSVLRQHLQEKQAHNMPDNTVPTLIERIDHLDSLLKQEAQQLNRLKTAYTAFLQNTSSAS